MAASKKDFTSINTNRVYSTIETATGEPTEPQLARRPRSQAPTQEEVDMARDLGKTQGRKGCKAIRINMAFAPDVHDYVTTMARAAGMSITEFTNVVFRQHMENNMDQYEKAKEFRINL